ncbi:tyrosine recombinase XerC [Ligilactobacillus saerimneri]|uniref:tyrosine recombinase XerC n=1 Tax=Ligilactobacillus saerimneri TaxID=228229 RepID=UPI0030CFB2D1
MEKEWLNEFKRYLLVERQYSDNTATAYLKDIKHFSDFLQANGGSSSFADVGKFDVHVYMSYLYDQNYRITTVSRMVSSLRSFYHFLDKNGYCQDNPFAYVQLKRQPRSLPRFFYMQEMQALFDATTGDDPILTRDRALLETLYGTGMRVSECTGLTLAAIDFNTHSMLLHGKGNKERYVPFGSYCAEALQKYFQTYRTPVMQKYHKEHDYVFINHYGDPITAAGVTYVLQKIIERSSLTTSIHPHELRHTFATHMMNNGADLRSVQELLGHSSLSTTQIYTHITTEHLQRDYQKYFKRK